MLSSELRDSRDAHGIGAVKARGWLTEMADMDIPEEHQHDLQTEVLDPLQAIITHCEGVARACDDQIGLQSSDHDIQADADRERAG